ncbi:MAG: SDR family oxidoreductase [Alteraurantiacibacter sp.]
MSESAAVAIVTGGSGGIAPAIAVKLAQAGMIVVVTARRRDALEEVAADLRAQTGQQIYAATSDALDTGSIKAMVDGVLARHGRIDALVNAAASSSPIGGAIEEVDVDALIGDVNVKVGGYLRYTQAVVSVMKQQRAGQIVNIGGLTGRSSDTLSGLRNAAVAHMTKVLSDQLGVFGIAVNAVHPGIVDTPHLRELFADIAMADGMVPAAVEAGFVSQIPSRTLLEPADIARLVAFLVMASGVQITGQSLSVDGGYSRGIYL